MLEIRPDQIEEFRRQAIADYEVRAVRHLRTQLAEPTSAFTDDELVARVRFCGPRAKAYGLESQQQIICFVDASFLLKSERFDEDPDHDWAGQVLRSEKLEPGEKAAVLLNTACTIYNTARSGEGAR